VKVDIIRCFIKLSLTKGYGKDKLNNYKKRW